MNQITTYDFKQINKGNQPRRERYLAEISQADAKAEHQPRVIQHQISHGKPAPQADQKHDKGKYIAPTVELAEKKAQNAKYFQARNRLVQRLVKQNLTDISWTTQ